MTEQELIALVTKHESALVYDVEIKSYDNNEEELYCELSYQIDDRKGRMDSEVENAIQAELGEEYGVSVDRQDAYPNGYAHYHVTIDRCYE
jgi:hypothetical protein